MRPTLLRVLTDLYVQKPAHSPDEERHYTELALRLIEVVDDADRLAVAGRLVNYPGAPKAVLLRLARDMSNPARPALAPGEADTKATAPRAPAKPVDAAELCELFFASDSAERRLILLNLDYAPIAPAAPLHKPHAREAARRIETAALARSMHEVAIILVGTLGITQAQAMRIVQDATGEPMIAAAKAMAIPAETLQRIALFLNPAIGQSVQRVYDLATLYDEITQDSALRLITIWRQSAAMMPRHQTVYHGDAPNPRAMAQPQPHTYSSRFGDTAERVRRRS